MRSIKRDFKQSGKQKKDGRVLIKQGRGSRMKAHEESHSYRRVYLPGRTLKRPQTQKQINDGQEVDQRTILTFN